MIDGHVYWITGLPGAGKTTISGLFFHSLKARKANVVLLDGDRLRDVIGDDLGYDLAARQTCARRYARLCKFLAEQGIDVVCATVSMIDEVRAWNRKHITRYREIYLEVPMNVLIARDQRLAGRQLLRSCDVRHPTSG